MSRVRDAWSSVVDAIASMDNTDALPPKYDAIEFLPQRQLLPTSLVDGLREKDGGFATQAADSFQEQMSFLDGCHSKPNNTAKHPDAASSSTNTNKGTGEGGADFFGMYQGMLTHAASSSKPQLPAARLSSGFLYEEQARRHLQPDFMPIILVPSAVTSPLQMLNIKGFLEHGIYVDPTTLYVDEQTGATNVQETKPELVMVSPGSFIDRSKYRIAFHTFRVLDDATQVEDWRHVCAAFVDGRRWQFASWFPNAPSNAREPSVLFHNLLGFLPYFEEDKIPPATQQWRVRPLLLTRRVVKSHQHILQASVFWEQLFLYLDEHPFFKAYTVKLDD